MLSKILKLENVEKLNKSKQQTINGGSCRTNLRCSTSQDCWTVTGDMSDKCFQGYCHIF